MDGWALYFVCCMYRLSLPLLSMDYPGYVYISKKKMKDIVFSDI